MIDREKLFNQPVRKNLRTFDSIPKIVAGQQLVGQRLYNLLFAGL